MSSFFKRMMRQIAVYWPPAGKDEFGKPTFEEAEEMSCRWEDTAEEFIQPNGERAISRARLFLAEALQVGGLVMLGTLEDLEDSSFPEDPREAEGVWEIRSVAQVPNLKATVSVWQAFV